MNPSLDWYLWIVIVGLQLAIGFRVILSDIQIDLPAFTGYALYSSATSTALLLFGYITRDGVRYGYLNSIASIGSVIFTVLAAMELWREVFGPKRALPPKTAARYIAALAGIYPTCLWIAQMCRARNGSEFASSMWTIELIATSVSASTMLTLVAYSRRLHITWRPRLQRIATGFLVLLSANAFAALAAGRLLPMLTAQRFGQVAAIAALGIWFRALWIKEPLPRKASLEVAQFFWNELMREAQEEPNVAH